MVAYHHKGTFDTLRCHAISRFLLNQTTPNSPFHCTKLRYEIYPKKRNEEVSKHLAHLLEMCDGDFCFVVWDNASQHTTPMLLPFLCDNSHRLMMVNLPTYSPHLNKIEKLWWYMRDKITRNHFYQTFDALCQALTGWLERLPFSRFCSLMGIKPREQPIAA